MTPRDRTITFRPDPDLLIGMEQLQERHGTPFSEQIRRALRAWLESQGVIKSERRRAATRKRS